MKNLIGSLKMFRYRFFYAALTSRRYPLTTLGNAATCCAWNFSPAGLNERSIVYSAGVGRDITFEHGLVKNYGCNVLLLDPSPTGVETMALPENKIPQFKHLAVALAARCGTLKFSRPMDEREGSWYMQTNGPAALEVPCVDLTTLMQQNGHDHIDLLKIDIEGAEYEVLDDLYKRRLPVNQVLVEFHRNLVPGGDSREFIRVILRMRRAGYRLIDMDGGNHTFLKPPR